MINNMFAISRIESGFKMRVIAGTARRLPLVAPDGMDTRPTTDRIKETLFNVLQEDVPDCDFLDLFSGSGGIAIEALSRGARHAVLVEKGREALSCIDINLAKTRMKESATVLPMDCVRAIAKLSQQGEKFDIIYMDPPYRLEQEGMVLEAIYAGHILKENGQVIVEMSKDRKVDYVNELHYDIEKIKNYKTNQHVFLRFKND